MVKLSVDKNASFSFFCLKQEVSICNVFKFIIFSNMFYNLKINPLYLSLYFNKREKFLCVWIFLNKTIFMNRLLAKKKKKVQLQLEFSYAMVSEWLYYWKHCVLLYLLIVWFVGFSTCISKLQYFLNWHDMSNVWTRNFV